MPRNLPAEIAALKRRIAHAKASHQAVSYLEYQLQQLVSKQLKAELRAQRRSA
jgi:hypothetical protein